MTGKQKETKPIDHLTNAMFKETNLSEEERKKIKAALDSELYKKPFRVAVIGQSGVGKSSIVNAMFGVSNYVSDVMEGTTDVVEQKFELLPNFTLSLFDMPGLNNDVKKDMYYEEVYRKILPKCDVILYVINSHSRDIGEDCRILKEVVLPICLNNKLTERLVVAFNKIDTIGESIDPTDPELKWNIFDNLPTEKLKDAILVKLNDFIDKLISENLIDDKSGVKKEMIVFCSALFNYNLQPLFNAICSAGDRGWIYAAVCGVSLVGKYESKVINKKSK